MDPPPPRKYDFLGAPRCGSLFHVLHTWELVVLAPIAFGVSYNPNLQSQSYLSLFNETWQTRSGELDHGLRFEIEEMTLQMQ